MSDIRFNRWLHQSGTGGVSQDSSGNIGIGTTVPTMALDVRGNANFSDTVNATTLSAVDGTFTGNVTIGGTLTYEDVANIDAVGIITAQSDIIVGGGLTVTGISTFNNDVKLLDSDKLKFGIGEDLQIYHDPGTGDSFISESGIGNLKLTTGSFRLRNAADTEHIIWANQDAEVRLYHDNSKKFETTSSGAIVTGILTASTFSGNLTGNITGNVTGDLTGNLAGISSIAAVSSTISDTAVDVFVYDTRKDSDGGAWRKRTQHTSWYNETLGTATRGTRREFPSVAVLVLSAHKLTIYDGDDPDLPMWMEVYQYVSGGNSGTTTNWHGGSGTFSSVAAINGIIICGTTGTRNLHFINDRMSLFYTPASGNYTQLGGISNRNVSYTSWGPSDSYYAQIVATPTNDVAMTVLPNAPIDDATGLPVPTIAVATNGGISFIRDNGTVVDNYRGTNQVASIAFDVDNSVIFTWGTVSGAPRHITRLITSVWNTESSSSSLWTNNYFSSISEGLGNSAGNYETAASGVVTVANSGRHFGINYGSGDYENNSDDKLGILHPRNLTNYANQNLSTFITSSYNTGYMHGNVRGALLCDTDTTNVTAVVVNSSTSDWSQQGSYNWTITSATEITVSSVTAGQSAVLRLTTDSSKQYTYSFNVTVLSDNMTFRNDQGAEILPIPTSTGVYTGWFTGTSYVDFTVYQNDSATITSIDIREAERDRSYANKGLKVYGTITKTAVAAGADLVAYSGWDISGGNYLEQPYNAGLNFTGDYHISVWLKQTYNQSSHNQNYVFHRVARSGGSTTGARYELRVPTNLGNFRFYQNDGSNVSYSDSSGNSFPSATWTHVVCGRSGGDLPIYINGKYDTVSLSGDSNVKNSMSNTNAKLFMGGEHQDNNNAWGGDIALFRIGVGFPSPEQIKKIYEDEKHLFQENAKATLYGSSDAITALTFDDDTDILHVGTSAGRSEFQGLRRINNTTDAVTTAISASNGFVAEQ